MNWGIEDWVAAALMLLGTGLGFALVFKTVRARKARVVLASVVVLVSLLIWAHLAVGVF